MYVSADGGLVISPTDLTNFLACRHLTQLDLATARGLVEAPDELDDALAVLRERGIRHEQAYLERLRSEGRTIVEINAPDLRSGERETVDAMRAGVEVIYQATFFDGQWRGHADFLEKRADRPSQLGGWSYDVADTKLARRVSVAALLQMATYAERLASLQGREPEFLTVITGDGERRIHRLDDCAAYARRVRAALLAAIAAEEPTYPEKVRHCARCRWDPLCSARRRTDDHLSLVAGMRRDQARRLVAAGVGSMTALAATDPATLPDSIAEAARRRLVQQARLQAEHRSTGLVTVELQPPQPGRGLARLPAPSPGDLFLDLEGDPYVGVGGLEYLFGICDAAGRFTAYWARTPADEKAAFEQAVDHVMDSWASDPEMHMYHYAPYEVIAFRRLSARHNTRVDEVDRLLRGGRLIDLYMVVRQSLRAGVDSYSLKKLEALYDPDARLGADVADAASSIVAFERWLADGNDAELAAIERYNEADCRSTLRLRNWLEERRADLVTSGATLTRPESRDGLPSERSVAVSAATGQLYRELTAGLPEDSAEDDPDQRAIRLLADLLDWHRREARPEWWEFFGRLDLNDEGLVDDPAAVGLLGPPVLVRDEARATVWRMEFPPQDTKLQPGESRYVDPVSGRVAGTVVAVDAEQGWLELRRGADLGPPTCRSLVPGGPIDDAVQRAALRRLGEWVRDHGVDGAGEGFRSARDLLLWRRPRGAPPGPLVALGEEPTDAVVRLAGGLAGGCLAVQGPPGSGKTWAAAEAVLALVADGRRVGICAFSHQAIVNLLDSVVSVASRRGIPLRAVQKAAGADRSTAPGVLHTNDAGVVAQALHDGEAEVVAGTSWLFAREDMAGAVDTLVVDEAGQLSLANVLAVAGSGRDVLLVGDPQQLSQPAKGDHPPGAAASALQHLLAGAATIRPDLGVFLDRTWRMHPEVCRLVSEVGYDGRLRAHDRCARQRIDAPGQLSGSGLRWVPVEHDGNRSASGEEVAVVSALYHDLLAGSWTDSDGWRHSLTCDDVLVLAPYNAQVGRLRSTLPAGARIGTVDRFQGQEAPAVLYSIATSSPEIAPHGGDFLYSLNRLNVAVSRAKALVAIVANPGLLDAAVRTAGELRAVNALCRFAELAEPSSSENVRARSSL